MRDEALFCYLFYLSKENATMKIIYKDGHVDECPQDQELHVIRHTAAHIMAQAIKRLYPQADFAFGPACSPLRPRASRWPTR